MLKEGRLYKDTESDDHIVFKVDEVMPNGDFWATVIESSRKSLVGTDGLIDKDFEDDFVLYKQKVRRLK